MWTLGLELDTGQLSSFSLHFFFFFSSSFSFIEEHTAESMALCASVGYTSLAGPAWKGALFRPSEEHVLVVYGSFAASVRLQFVVGVPVAGVEGRVGVRVAQEGSAAHRLAPPQGRGGREA